MFAEACCTPSRVSRLLTSNVAVMKGEWHGRDYTLVRKNCNHFCEVCKQDMSVLLLTVLCACPATEQLLRPWCMQLTAAQSMVLATGAGAPAWRGGAGCALLLDSAIDGLAQQVLQWRFRKLVAHAAIWAVH